jgi:type IV secretory pathway TraG/TraD family ATPase VirD4
VGSGKTSGSGAAIARACLSAGFGGLVLTAKPDERGLFERYARETGRSDDLIIVSPRTPHRFNFLDYEWSRAGAGAGLVENVVQLFMLAMEVAGARQDGGNDEYWKRSTTQLLRNDVQLAGLATGGIRLKDLLAILRSAPKSIEEVRAENSTWRGESFCFASLLAASKRLATEVDRLDYDQMEAYWLSEFPELAQKTRSIIVQSFVSLIDPFTRSPLRELFCTDTTFTPEDAQRGKVIILDLPVKEWGDVGRIAQVLFKVCFQKATERRNIEKSPVPVFLFADEAQLFLTSYDEQFLQTARSSRAITVYLSQNLPNYYSALGGNQKAEHQANSILGNLSTHIYHANGDVTTNEYAAKRIAQVWQMRQGSNSGHSSNMSQTGGSLNQDTTTNVNYSDNSGTSMSEQLAYQVLPQEFTTYRQGGPLNRFEVDALVFKPGVRWNGSGKNFLRVSFRQR